MEAYIGNKQSHKILRVYLLRTCYELSRSLQKDISSMLVSNCLIIRMCAAKNDTQFGYKEQLKTGNLKKIHFVYLPSLDDLITFLWAHLQTPKPLTAGIFIDGIQSYFGERFDFQDGGKSIAVCMNLLRILGGKSIKKVKVKVGFSYCYNPYVFHRKEFMKFVSHFGCTSWDINSQQIMKNGEEFENETTKKFLHLYGHALVKNQQ